MIICAMQRLNKFSNQNPNSTDKDFFNSQTTETEQKSSNNQTPSELEKIAKEKLSRVKVASLYERITDGVYFGRTTDDVLKIFKETNTDLILRGFFRWLSVPESSTSVMPGYPTNYSSLSAQKGYTYEQYEQAINKIKTAKPDTIIVGAIAAQRLNKIDFNDITYESAQTWEMALDAKKFNFDISKEALQNKASQYLGWSDNSPAYFPDITNNEYQKILLSWAEKQINIGVDAIWIDMLYAQASLMKEYTGNPNHPAVKASYEASSKIIDDIHEYGLSKGKYILVGTWYNFSELPYPFPDIDFVTVSPKSEEITNGLDDERWNNIKNTIKNIPIIAFIDWSGSINSPMGTFSQSSTEKQNEFLKSAHDFFATKGILFAYPIHGGTWPNNKEYKLSFGKYGTYDSLAPEFQTYSIIKELTK